VRLSGDLGFMQVNYLLGKQAYFGETASEVNFPLLFVISKPEADRIE